MSSRAFSSRLFSSFFLSSRISGAVRISGGGGGSPFKSLNSSMSARDVGTESLRSLESAYAKPVPGEIDTADNTFIDGTVQIVQLSSGGGGSRNPYMC